MKRELSIIILSFFLIILIIVILFQNISTKDIIQLFRKDTIQLFKTDETGLLMTDRFSPLEYATVRFRVPRNVQEIKYRISDSTGYIYQEGRISEWENRYTQISFLTGYALGKHRIDITYYFPDNKIRTDLKEFILDAETAIVTGHPIWDNFYPLMKKFILRNRRNIQFDSVNISGYRAPDTTPIFLRDHTYQMRGFKYFETDMKSTVDYFFSRQQPNGSFLEFIWLNPQTGRYLTIRHDVNADAEFLMVIAAYQIWQATGDDEWLKDKLGSLEKGLNYSMTDPFRWSAEYQLVKRPYTIDTWDFEFQNAEIPYDRSRANLGIMHGDNSGMYAACAKLARIYRYFGNEDKYQYWSNKADHFKRQLNKISWNGRFYTHRIDIDPVEVEGVNENEILSISNAFNINRSVTSHEQAVSIINEYLERKKTLYPPPFAEWFSIQPWFPSGSFEPQPGSWTYAAGEYVNGGILPIVGGELSHAGFHHGFENYAVCVLQRYYELTSTTGRAYLWYHWDGRPGISCREQFSSDGWGASSMLFAFMEGLAGVKDRSKLYNDVQISPRWIAANVTTARVVMRYAASEGYIGYLYNYDKNNDKITIQYTGSGNNLAFSVLLPSDYDIQDIRINEQPVTYQIKTIENSRYAVLSSTMDYNKLVISLKKSEI